ncbi:MAG: acylphosphatase [Deltaproteobacteria bacterium]|nr:acylphosphatase [Deltaproteobacteria bacterium]
MERARFRAVVTGRVQGVSFRAWTAQEAHRLGLSGWVRNLPDGSVELEAEGPKAALESLLACCKEGPPLAHVASVRAEWKDPTGENHGFRVRH